MAASRRVLGWFGRWIIVLVLVSIGTRAATAQTRGVTRPGSGPVRETTAEVMARQAASSPRPPRPEHELRSPDRSGLAQNPNAPAESRFPSDGGPLAALRARPAVHSVGIAFDGPTLNDTRAFPPDSMGEIGPTQYVAFVNGRLRTYTRAGAADGVLDVDPDGFFASVMTPVGSGVTAAFTSDPQIRYDRFNARWYLAIIDVPCTNATCTTTAANRWLLAVSDAASAGTISGSTVWSFFYFKPSPATSFCDYPSLGSDVSALYVGCIMFSSTGSFEGTDGYVVRKSSILSAGPIFTTRFASLVAGAGAGPFAPRGVDNLDPGATEGYFVGVDNANFGKLVLRRITDPGSATPTISGDLSVTVPATTFPIPVTHLGNTGGTNGRLASLDDRLFAAVIRNGRLWTAHNIRVSTAGVASTAPTARNASRWYELQSLTGTPSLVQAGTVFDSAATLAASRQHFIPSITVTGQGHAVMGFTMAGDPVGATPAYASRLVSDTLGTMSGPPGSLASTFGTSAASYNPPGDSGGSAGRRWGDYSFSSTDPLDDMTVWTIQEYNQSPGLYAVRVGRLLAPPPATPTCTSDGSSPIPLTGGAGTITVDATSSAGSGFYDPGPDLPLPAVAYHHLSATVSDATVAGVTYVTPTRVQVQITGATPGLHDLTVVNPDGQSVTALGCISVPAAADLSITKTDGAPTATPGGAVVYTIQVSNATSAPASGAAVRDLFPAPLSCVWACAGSLGGTCTAVGYGDLLDTVDLPAGASVTYAATCLVDADASGMLSNTATVELAGDPDLSNNTADDVDTLVPVADLGITKDNGVHIVAPGEPFTYEIVVTNAGPSSVDSAHVLDALPETLSCNWTCAESGGGVCADSGSGDIDDHVSLPVSASVTYTAVCTVDAPLGTTLENTANVSSATFDPDTENNFATDSDTVSVPLFEDDFESGGTGRWTKQKPPSGG